MGTADRTAVHSMGRIICLPRPLGEIVRDVLSRGDDCPWTTPQESRGAWSEERIYFILMNPPWPIHGCDAVESQFDPIEYFILYAAH